ncbi:MAG: glycosyltransferase family 1 protein [Stigonema ocellatum SAG 48.90 = DSM 106950]|nr:glycosyltransferase family 1 protein [Stigonema ocellatum SAG 48.90 = DSM 106950]
MVIRILHVVGGMSRGGIETWLMHILRYIDRQNFQMDFLVHTEQPCAYDDEIYTLGSKIIPCLHPSRPWMYAHNFKRILCEYGPYDIVHSHVHHFSGYVLRLAEKAGVPVRIAHSHLDSSPLEAKAGLQRHLYLTLMKDLIARHATNGLGCSYLATLDLFGQNWKADPRWHILYYGIDLTPFREPINVVEVRSEFNLPADAFVIGHVGRFDPQKNHQFLLKIFALVASKEPQAYLLLVGEGPLRETIEQQALKIGVANRIIFAGSRPDVPRLMHGAMDVFLFPSLCEGLGLVLIEAQAAGLPCIFSDVVPQEADVVKPLMKRLSLSQSVSDWAVELLAWRNQVSQNVQNDGLKFIEGSPFNIETSVKQLEKIYQAQFARKVLL